MYIMIAHGFQCHIREILLKFKILAWYNVFFYNLNLLKDIFIVLL